ncbi:10630_t:CDS:1, partial [Funneliformis geosporum]
DPESSVFGIKYDKNTTVDEIRDAIKDKSSPILDDISVKDLTLYQVNINLAMQNPNELLSAIQMPTL